MDDDDVNKVDLNDRICCSCSGGSEFCAVG